MLNILLKSINNINNINKSRCQYRKSPPAPRLEQSSDDPAGFINTEPTHIIRTSLSQSVFFLWPQFERYFPFFLFKKRNKEIKKERGNMRGKKNNFLSEIDSTCKVL